MVRQVQHLDVHRDDLREMQLLDERNRAFDQRPDALPIRTGAA